MIYIYLKIRVLITVVLSLLLMGACSDNDSAGEGINGGQHVWYEVTGQSNYSAMEAARLGITAQINGKDTSSTVLTDVCNYLNNVISGNTAILRSVIIHYNSVDADNNPIVLSGRIMFHATADGTALRNPANILMANHYTYGADYECPSRTMPPEAVLAVEDAMVVCPDYIGYGASRSKPHPFLCTDLTARNCTDMAKAALQYLEDQGSRMQDGYGFFNEGYSQSGHVALGIHKYIEQHPDLNAILPLKATNCGGGPYDVYNTMYQYINGFAKERRLILIPVMVIGMKAGFPDIMKNVEVEDYLSDKFVNSGILNLISDKNMTLTELNDEILSKVGNSADDVFSKEAADTSCYAYKCLATALKINDLTTGWKPQHPVKFYHSVSDGEVPYDNMVKAVTGLSNDNVYWTNGLFLSHNNYGALFYLNGLLGGFLNDDFSTSNKAADISEE